MGETARRLVSTFAASVLATVGALAITPASSSAQTSGPVGYVLIAEEREASSFTFVLYAADFGTGEMTAIGETLTEGMIFTALAVAVDGTLLATAYDVEDDNETRLFLIDPATGAATELGLVSDETGGIAEPIGLVASALTSAPDDQVFLSGVTPDGAPAPVYLVDLTGVHESDAGPIVPATPIGNTENLLLALDSSCAGSIFGLGVDPDAEDQGAIPLLLTTVDPVSGTDTTVGELGVTVDDDSALRTNITVDRPQDTIYLLLGDGTLATIDPASGGAAGTGTTLALDEDQFVFATAIPGDSCAPPPAPSKPALVRTSTTRILGSELATGGGTTSTFTYGTKPLTPLFGDWDGNGSKTTGTFEAGTFKLRNSNSAGAADLTFTFGNSRGYAVAGDFNGDGTDDVAVFRNGTWQVRLSTGASFSFSFGTDAWPNTVPVTGDWDGNGADGIGTYTRGTATWNLRNTASAGAVDIGPFVFGIANSSYPVTGDWDGDGTDTVGIKTGSSWIVRAVNSGAPLDPSDILFDFGLANDLPMSWRP